MMMRVLRGAAIAIAVGGVADPACDVRTIDRPTVAVEIVDTPSLALPAEGGGTRRDAASRARHALTERLSADWNVVEGPVSTAAARVVVGDAPPAIDLGTWDATDRREPQVHAVTVASPLTPNVRITRAHGPRRITIWDSAAIGASIEGRGLKGESVVVRLFKDGVPLASAEHRWRTDLDVFEAQLVFLPPAVGAHRLEIRATSAAVERTELDNRVSLLIDTNAVRRRVLVHQPRLSWMSAFVARAIERDPRLEVSSRAQASRGIAVTAGKDREGFDAFDAIVIGAPDVLTRAEVEALNRYVTVRGGSVLLVADRKPAGPSLGLAPATSFDEVLLDAAVDLAPGLRASELSVPRQPREGWETIGRDGSRPVIMTAPRGRGRILFSGALDAWRFRERSRYWQDLIAGLAARAPAAVELRVEPAIARPGELIEVSSDTTAARVAGEAIRLWPGGEPGLFRGQFRAPVVAGTLTVRAERGGAVAEASVFVDPAAAHPWADRDSALEAFAAAHGGKLVRAEDVGSLGVELRQSADGRPASRTIRPMRSAWWIAPFASLLAAEWTLRRRHHLH